MKCLFVLNLLLFTNILYADHKEDFENLNVQLKSGKIISCRGFDLHDVDFSRLNLEEADFSGANLKGANFSKTNLRNALFINARLSRSNFCNADLTEADFTNAVINGSQFKKATLFKINYSHIKSAKGTLFEDKPALVYKLNMEQEIFHTEHYSSKNKVKLSHLHVSKNKSINKSYDTSNPKLSLNSEKPLQRSLDTEYLFSKYTLDLHGKIPLPIKYQRIDTFIKKAHRQHLDTVEIITGRGLNNPDGKMGILWSLCKKYLRKQELQPYIHNIKATSKNGGWIVNLKQSPSLIIHNPKLIKSNINQKNVIKQKRRILQNLCRINNPTNLSKKL